VHPMRTDAGAILSITMWRRCAICYPHTIVGDARGVRRSIDVPPDDNDTIVDDARGVQPSTDAYPDDNDLVRENACDQKRHLGPIRRSHGMTRCEAKSTWRKRRRRGNVMERPSNLSELIDIAMELVDDDYTFARVSDACGVQDSSGESPDDNGLEYDYACVSRTRECEDVLESTSEVPDSARESCDDILRGFVDYLRANQASQLPARYCLSITMDFGLCSETSVSRMRLRVSTIVLHALNSRNPRINVEIHPTTGPEP
jgi:hypothetical protein